MGTTTEDTSWVAELSNITDYVYVADNSSAPFHPPENKGHETMIYLSYIIDHYNNLSDTTIFTHGGREAWHNNDLQDFNLVRMISSLSDAHVNHVGYFNLRCHWESGCPDHMKPFATDHEDRGEEQRFATAWAEIHGPEIPVPEVLGTACCAQFAASRDAIRAVPLKKWLHYREWLLNTPLEDDISGRVWEFVWQFVLTGQAVVCPAVEHCYCGGYGLCFQDDGELSAWLVLKEVEELAKEVHKDMKEREWMGTGAIDYRLWQKIQRPMLKLLRKAELRGQDPSERRRLSGEARGIRRRT
ncbi:hypothetical protein M8818_006565 [Zalaria obscura]|uniref:Uncharacterized protein n=1 Tax=Zalaria obscura TaxID=2024903 RepID=A0ACC3S6V6_9PEZI